MSLVGLPEVGVPLLAAGGFAVGTGKVIGDQVGGSLTHHKQHLGAGFLADVGDGIKKMGRQADKYGLQAVHGIGDAFIAAAPMFGDGEEGIRNTGEWMHNAEQKHFKALNTAAEGMFKGLHGLDKLFEGD